jgi:hypothetical protein
MNKLFVKLDEKTTRALLKLSHDEYRDPRAQASLLIKESLEKRGLLGPTILPETEPAQAAVIPHCPEEEK